MMEAGQKKYSIIYADPPWEYQVWSKRGEGKAAANHYTIPPFIQLKMLPVAEICDKNCALLMWATSPCLKEAFELGQAWGFVYKTIAFVWIKTNKKSQSLFTGLGYYTRSNMELVLLFTKGKPLKRKNKNVHQVLISKIGRHSIKPPEIRDRIVALFGDLPRVELFARSRQGFFPDFEYDGWDVFGNEIKGSIKL